MGGSFGRNKYTVNWVPPPPSPVMSFFLRKIKLRLLLKTLSLITVLI